jgi:site-specific DNA-methyltransferase (adenine-specific)
MTAPARAPRNRTLRLSPEDRERLRPRLAGAGAEAGAEGHLDRTFLGDFRDVMPRLPRGFADLVFLDPPYNLDKQIAGQTFRRRSVDDYTAWLGEVLDAVLPALAPNGTVYICGDWFTSASIFAAAAPRLIVRNRITWEREKGRGAKANWKNASEDIWFCTRGDDYTFNVGAVKLRRRVLAPYRDAVGAPRDWQATSEGKFRDTYPSNLWTDITIPFWSMSENTDHPAQKSEKLLAKLILASTHPGEVVFDPFLGSGTASVVARKLGRRYVGIEIAEDLALIAEQRLALAAAEPAIQGYVDRVFWERNSSSPARPGARSGGRRTARR